MQSKVGTKFSDFIWKKNSLNALNISILLMMSWTQFCASFGLEVRSTVPNKTTGEFEMYSISSLRNLRNGLTRELK